MSDSVSFASAEFNKTGWDALSAPVKAYYGNNPLTYYRASSGFNGFPFPLPQATAWDGKTFFNPDPEAEGGYPSSSGDEYKPVYGEGTGYPIGFSFQDAIKLFWRMRFVTLSWDYCYEGSTDAFGFKGTLGYEYRYDAPGPDWGFSTVDRLGAASESGLGATPNPGATSRGLYCLAVFGGGYLPDYPMPETYDWDLGDDAGLGAAASFYVPAGWAMESSFFALEFGVFCQPFTLPSGYGLPPLAVLGDDGLVYPGICFDISDSPSGPTGLTKFSAGGAADGLLTMNGQTVKTYPTYFYSDGDGVNNYQLYVNVETPTAFWPYKNSAGEDVFNTTSGDQEADIS